MRYQIKQNGHTIAQFDHKNEARGYFANADPHPLDCVGITRREVYWPSVKPGDAFKTQDLCSATDTVYYVGPRKGQDKEVVVEYESMHDLGGKRYSSVAKTSLTRYPEGDGDIFK